jgi:hypothetical protein
MTVEQIKTIDNEINDTILFTSNNAAINANAVMEERKVPYSVRPADIPFPQTNAKANTINGTHKESEFLNLRNI